MLQLLQNPSRATRSRGGPESAHPVEATAAAMTDAQPSVVERVAAVTPEAIARRVRGLSDRVIAWLFIAPTIVLLLAINIFPLLWPVYLSFTNYRANRPNAPVVDVGTQHYSSILTDPDIWQAMQATAHFV